MVIMMVLYVQNIALEKNVILVKDILYLFVVKNRYVIIFSVGVYKWAYSTVVSPYSKN